MLPLSPFPLAILWLATPVLWKPFTNLFIRTLKVEAVRSFEAFVLSYETSLYVNSKDQNLVRCYRNESHYLPEEINRSKLVRMRDPYIRKWTTLWHRVTWIQKPLERIGSSGWFHRSKQHFCYLISFLLSRRVRRFCSSSCDPPSSHYWPVGKK
jgi:hypothetical protein